MAKRKKKKDQLNSLFLLKIALYLIIGSQWLKIITPSGVQIPIPVGALIGVIFATHDHFVIDRKIEYAVLLAAMFIGYWVPLGTSIALS